MTTQDTTKAKVFDSRQELHWRGKEVMFAPGAGEQPPYLAGRAHERHAWERALRVLLETGGSNPEGHLALYGPRGNGKTVLAEQWRREAGRAGVRAVDVAGGPDSALANLRALAEALQGEEKPTWWKRLRGVRVGVGLPQVGEASLAAQWEGSKASVLRLLREGVQPTGQAARPLILFLDEAHHVHLDFLAEAFRCSQLLTKQGLPLLWVFCGTPDMPRHFRAANATFWNRCARLPLGRLEPAEAVAALREPLRARGWDVESGEAEALLTHAAVEHAQRYPYFVQALGKALEQHESPQGSLLNRETLRAALPSYEQVKADYYADRWRELDQLGLLEVAAETGRRMQQQAGRGLRETEVQALLGNNVLPQTLGREPPAWRALGISLRRAAADNAGVAAFLTLLETEPDGLAQGSWQDKGAVAVFDLLCDTGFLWARDPKTPVELGIPSLAAYLAGAGEPAAPVPGEGGEARFGGDTSRRRRGGPSM